MTDETSNLILEWMRRLDLKFETQVKETRGLRQEVAGLRILMLSDMQHREVDREDLADLRLRVERIEARLDLVEEARP